MKHLLTLLGLIATVITGAQTPYNPDSDNNQNITVADLTSLLAVFGESFSPSLPTDLEVVIDEDVPCIFGYHYNYSGEVPGILVDASECIYSQISFNAQYDAESESFLPPQNGFTIALLHLSSSSCTIDFGYTNDGCTHINRETFAIDDTHSPTAHLQYDCDNGWQNLDELPNSLHLSKAMWYNDRWVFL